MSFYNYVMSGALHGAALGALIGYFNPTSSSIQRITETFSLGGRAMDPSLRDRLCSSEAQMIADEVGCAKINGLFEFNTYTPRMPRKEDMCDLSVYCLQHEYSSVLEYTILGYLAGGVVGATYWLALRTMNKI